MSDRFDDDVPEEPVAPVRTSGRSRALLITGLVLVLAFFALTTFATIYTDRLWYRAEGYGEVFTKLFWTRTSLFLIFGLLMALSVGVNMYFAHRFRPFFRPDSPEQAGLERYRDAVLPVRGWLVAGVSVVIGLFAGTAAAGEWRTYLLWANRTSFDRADSFFNKDIGFYVFELPWFHYLVNFTMAALVISLLAAATVHYLYGGIRLQTPGDRLTGAAQVQFSVLLGLFVLAKAVDYWLDRYDLVSASGKLIDGVTYTDDHAVLPAKNILLGIAVICAVLFFLNIWRRTWTLPSVGLALLVLSAILLGMIWPGIVQAFQVRPTEPDKEAPYIAANIAATRMAYDVQDVEVKGFTDQSLAGTEDQGGGPGRHRVGAARRPAAGAPGLRADPAGPVLLLGRRRARRRPLRHRRHRPRPRARRARAGPERHLRRRPQLVEPAHRLHPRQRADRRVRQPAAGRRRHRGHRDPVGRGPAGEPERPVRGHRRVREPRLLRRAQPGLLHRRQARPALRTSSSTSVGKPTAATPRRTRARAASTSAARSASCCTPSSSATRTSCSPSG